MSLNGRAGKPYERPRSRAGDGKWVHDKAPGMPKSVVNSTRNVPSGPAVNTKLVVSNLHYNVTPKDLVTIFGTFGTLVREPVIKYDRSGRSTGIAYISFETPAEAYRAKTQLAGVMAKGQPMTISYDFVPRGPANGGPRRSASAPSSLLDRISKPPLLNRLAGKPEQKDVDMEKTRDRPSQGPVRSRRRRGGGGAGATGERGEKFKKEPKTVADLDKELEAFMGDDTNAANGAAEGDVEMAV